MNPNAKRLCVLVVEDDLDSQGLMHALLDRKFEVLVATSGEEVRSILEKHGDGIALVLMDISLKGSEDGLELTRQLKASARWASVPVVAVTAHAFLEDRRACLAAGCDAYISKPFGKQQLFGVIDGLLPPAEAGEDA